MRTVSGHVLREMMMAFAVAQWLVAGCLLRIETGCCRSLQSLPWLFHREASYELKQPPPTRWASSMLSSSTSAHICVYFSHVNVHVLQLTVKRNMEYSEKRINSIDISTCMQFTTIKINAVKWIVIYGIHMEFHGVQKCVPESRGILVVVVCTGGGDEVIVILNLITELHIVDSISYCFCCCRSLWKSIFCEPI